MQGRKRRMAVLLVVVGALAAITAGTTGARTDRGAAGTLHIFGYGPGDDVQENRATYAASQLPGVTIDRSLGSWDETKFLALLASGNVPDLVRMPRNAVGAYATKGVLQPLTSCISSVVKQYRKGPLTAGTWKGVVYGLPEFTNQITLLINKKAFQEAGVPLSAASTTDWKKLIVTARKLTTKDANGNLTRIGFDPKIPEFFPLWVKWFGKGKDSIISPDGLHARLNTPQAIKALDFTVGVINAEGGWAKFKSFRDTFDFFGKQNPIVKDQIGFWPMESFIYNVFSNNSPNIDLGSAFFTNHAGGPISMTSGNSWVIPKGSGDAADACAYMKAVTSVDAWRTAAKKRYDARKAAGSTFTGLYTANSAADKKVYEDIYQSFGFTDFDNAVKILVQAPNYSFELPPTPAGTKFTDAYINAINRVLTGQQSIKAALNQAQQEAQAAINAAK